MDTRELAKMELAAEPFPMVEHEFRIFIDEKTFDRICAGADNIREVGGILVGEALRDENGPFIRVDAIIEALHAEESGTELTITHATWNHIHQQMDTAYKGKRIVGWYHTHPNFGIFLSERDRFIQQSFFDLPFQIALVYDPVRREHGIFTWRENKPWRSRQYWIGNHQHLWDGDRNATDEADGRRQAPPKTSHGQREEARVSAAEAGPQTFGDLIGNTWLIGALLVGLLLGLALSLALGRWYPGGTATRSQTAQEAVASLDGELLGVIRGTVSDESFANTFDEGIARLDRAAEALKPLNISDPAVKSAVQSITEAQQFLSRARQDRLVAREMLKQLDLVMRRTRTPEFVARDLDAQRAALGAVYVELARQAASNKDGARASELLKKAMSIDPARQSEYEQHLKVYAQQGVPQSNEQNSDGKQQAQPSPSGASPSPAKTTGG